MTIPDALIARLRELLARPDQIRADMKDFDGDKRGHYGALEEAVDKLSHEAIRALPDLLDTLDAAHAARLAAEAEMDASHEQVQDMILDSGQECACGYDKPTAQT